MNYLDSIKDYYNPQYNDLMTKQIALEFITNGKTYANVAFHGSWKSEYYSYNKHHFYVTLRNAYRNKIHNIEELNRFINELNRVPYRDDGYYSYEYNYKFIGPIMPAVEFVFYECFSDELKEDAEAVKLFIKQSIFGKYFSNEIYGNYVAALTAKLTMKDPKTKKELTAKDYADFCFNNHILATTGWYRDESIENKYHYYVPDKYKYDPEFLRTLCRHNTEYIYKLYSYIEKTPDLIYTILDDNADKTINIRKLPEDVRDYISQKGTLRTVHIEDDTDKVAWIENNLGSSIYDKLRRRFGNSFDAKFPDKKDDKFFFIYKMLSSNPLESIYTNEEFTIPDTRFVQAFLNYIDSDEKLKEQYPTKEIRKTIDLIVEKKSIIANELFRAIFNNKQDDQAMKEMTEAMGYTKSNFFDKVKKNKYWDKEQKNELLIAFSQYFKTNTVITVYDIIDLLEEMEERALTKEEILKEHNMDPKYFEKLYKDLESTNHELFELIRNKLKNNSLRGFKKLLKLYYAIMNSKITDPDKFLERFKRTPEEAIKFFEYTEFASEISKKILSWYKPDTTELDSSIKAL